MNMAAPRGKARVVSRPGTDPVAAGRGHGCLRADQRGPSALRCAAAIAVLASVVAVASACSSAPDPFRVIYGTGVGPLITRPGWEYGYLFGDADNISHSTLTIDSVSLRGAGVGTVIALPDVRIAPQFGKPGTWVSSTNYLTDPPVEVGPDGCQKQALYPVKGYRLAPGKAFLIWIVVRALKPGRWNIPAQVVTFTENGGTYTHSFPIRYWGTVKTDAHVSPRLVPGDEEAQCVKPEKSHYLAHYHG
jgi:hypothetical protein